MTARRPLAPPLALLALLALLAGCVTEELLVSSKQLGQASLANEVEEEDGDRPTREQRLVTYTEEHPEDPRGWWRLGDFYESIRAYPQAIPCYVQLRALCEEAALREGRPFTAGDYHLGVVHAKARNFGDAVRYLGAVVALQPKDDRDASLNRHFREAHYWLGAIYFENRQPEPAREHFKAFERIGGEPGRVAPWLAQIEEATGMNDGRIERVPAKPPAGPGGDGGAAPPPTVPAAPR